MDFITTQDIKNMDPQTLLTVMIATPGVGLKKAVEILNNYFQSDPYQVLLASRKLCYEQFISFAHHLSERDNLIANLIYFADCPMADIINLQVKNIDISQCIINTKNRQIKIPPDIISKLEDFITKKESEDDDLVFPNRSGGKVNRSRLYRSFKNAGEKMSPPITILPTTLTAKK